MQAVTTDSVRLVRLLSDNDISLICLSDTDHYLMDLLSTVASFCVSDSPDLLSVCEILLQFYDIRQW